MAVSALIIFGILCFFNKIRKISALCLLPLILTLMFHFLFVRYSYKPMLSFCGKDLEIEGKVISDISSSEIRKNFKNSQNLMPDKVFDFLSLRGVYSD